MNTEKLTRANEISNRLKNVNSQLQSWEKACSTTKLQLKNETGSIIDRDEWYSLSPKEFEILKMYNISILNNEKKQLETEFSNL